MTRHCAATAPATTAARLARTPWFSGNAYQAALGVPELIATGEDRVARPDAVVDSRRGLTHVYGR